MLTNLSERYTLPHDGEHAGNGYEHEVDNSDDEEELPCRLPPLAKGDLADAQTGDEDSTRGADEGHGGPTHRKRGNGTLGVEAHELGQRTEDGHGEGRNPRGAGDEDGKHVVHGVQDGGEQHGRDTCQARGHGVENRVDDHAVVGDDEDAAGEADDDSGEREVLDTGDELTGDGGLVHAADDAGEQAHGQEDAGNLVHVPTLGDETPDNGAHTGDEDSQDGLLATGELDLQRVIVDGELLALGEVVLVGDGGLGVLLDVAGVHSDPGDAHDGEDHKGNHAQPQLGVTLDTDDALGDKDAEGVDGRGDVSDTGADEDDHEGGHRVEPHGHHDGKEDGEERQGLLGHAESGATEREQRHAVKCSVLNECI